MTEQAQKMSEVVETPVADLSAEQLEQVDGGARNGNLQITQLYSGAAAP